MNVCRICLTKDGRLYPIASNGLRSLYHQLTGVLKLEMEVDKRLPQYVCAECGLRLMSYNKLRQKSLRAHQILTNLLDKVTNITEEELDQIDREQNDLISNLSYVIRDNMTIQEYKVDKKQMEITDSVQKPEESHIELDMGEMCKTEKDSDTDFSYSKSNSDGESDAEDELLDKKRQKYRKSLQKKATKRVNKTTKRVNKTTKRVNKITKVVKKTNTRVKKEIVETKNKVDFTVQALSLDEEMGNNFVSLKDQYTDLLSTVKESLKTLAPKSLKARSKKAQSDIKKSVDKYMNSLDEKINKKEVKKRVRKKKEVVKKVAPDPFEDVFTKQILSFEEQLAEFEKRKFSPKYINAPFQCNQCLKGFTAEVTFERHKLMHTDKWGKFECKICKRRFRTISTYCDHKRSHKTLYSCKECNFKAGVRDMASLHRSKHKGTMYKCPHCNLEFVNKNTYMLHIRVKHVSQFVCELCGHSFVNAKGVELHKNLKHPLEIDTIIISADGPTCVACNIKFVSDEALSTHQRVAHPQPPDRSQQNEIRIIQCRETNKVCKVYPCRICGKEFSFRSNRTRHMIIHTGLRPYLCETCGSSFRTKGEVKAHTEHVHEKVPWPKKGERGSRRRGNQKTLF